jgi:hypothetical protein
MPNVTDPWKNPKAWETVILNGAKGIFALPNCEVQVRAGGVKEGEADVAGKDGVTRTFLGYKDAEATITATATNYKELANLQKALETYRSKRSRPGEDAIKLEVIHPKFTLHNVKYVYIFDVETSDFTLEDGVIFTFSVREWQPEEKRQTRGSSSRDGKNANKNAAAKTGGAGTGGSSTANGNKPGTKPATKTQQAQQNKPAQQKPSAVARGFQAGSQTAAGLLGQR